MEVYDSSIQRCARFFIGEVYEDLGGVGYSSSSGAKRNSPTYGLNCTVRVAPTITLSPIVSAPAFCALLERGSRRSCMSLVGYEPSAKMLPRTNSRVSGPSDRSMDLMFVIEYG